jgi:acyl carrier protein
LWIDPANDWNPMKNLKEQLKQMLIAELHMEDITPEDIGEDDLLFGKKFGLDSIDAVEVVYQLEKHFHVQIKDMKEGRPALQSINTLAAFIEARQSS